MSKALYFTDNEGVDHNLSEPKLVGLNFTEWWWLKEIMETQKCNYKTGGDHNELIVMTPSGDRYEIGQWAGMVTYVEKL